MITTLRFKKIEPAALTPTYQTDGASGFDFHSIEKVILRPGEITLVRTGLAVEVPSGYELQLRARSGLAAKSGVFLVNGVGTIDCDYRGEIKVIMSTCGHKPVFIERGDRIAQGIVTTVARAKIEVSENLTETIRGDGGFGSTDRSPDVSA